MSQFGSSKRLCNRAGLSPGRNQSAGKKKSVKISRAGVYLKPALVEAAHAAIKATVANDAVVDSVVSLICHEHADVVRQNEHTIAIIIAFFILHLSFREQ